MPGPNTAATPSSFGRARRVTPPGRMCYTVVMHDTAPASLLDWSQCPVVERISGKVSGAWLFKGTRTPVAIVFENLEDGLSIDEVIAQFPVTREQIQAVLEFTARSLDPAGA